MASGDVWVQFGNAMNPLRYFYGLSLSTRLNVIISSRTGSLLSQGWSRFLVTPRVQEQANTAQHDYSNGHANDDVESPVYGKQSSLGQQVSDRLCGQRTNLLAGFDSCCSFIGHPSSRGSGCWITSRYSSGASGLQDAAGRCTGFRKDVKGFETGRRLCRHCKEEM